MVLKLIKFNSNHNDSTNNSPNKTQRSQNGDINNKSTISSYTQHMDLPTNNILETPRFDKFSLPL